MKYLIAFLAFCLYSVVLVYQSYGYGFFKGLQANPEIVSGTHRLCKDTRTHIAWVTERDGQLRCFLEHREYPHKAKGHNISD